MAWLIPCLFFLWVMLALAALPDKPPMPNFLSWRPKHPQVVIVAVIIGLIGVYLRYQFPDPDGWILVFLVDLAPEMVGMAFTVVVIDELNQRRSDQQEKDRILERVKSPVRDISVEALRLIRKNDWLSEMLEQYDHILVDAQWQGANLRGARLEKVDLRGARLEKADLRGAHLKGAYLSQANLEGADLNRAHLEGADLMFANLQKAYLGEAHLEKANLHLAHLEVAYLSQAHLEGAVLCQAHLEKAVLSEAHLKGAMYTEDTKWPENFDPKEFGAIKVIRDKETGKWIPETDEE